MSKYKIGDVVLIKQDVEMIILLLKEMEGYKERRIING